MACVRLTALIICFSSLTLLLVSPTHSLTCTSQNFTNNHLYTNCTDLPSLNAYLHWTFNSTRSSLSIAFIAPPAKSDGWIAWAINPTGTGMAGSQALIAFKKSNGSMSVKTYNISSYSSIVQSKIAFNVSGESADFSGGLMRIYATLALPEGMTAVNQVWQVGGSVTGGVPDKHDFQPANLKATGKLGLVTSEKTGGSTVISPAGSPADPPATSPTTTTSTSTTTTAGGDSGGNSIIRNINFGFCILSFFASFVLCF